MRFVQETKSSKEQTQQLLNDTVIGELSTVIMQLVTRDGKDIFNNNSELVKVWIRLIESGKFSKEDIPKIGNLREVVYNILSPIQK